MKDPVFFVRITAALFLAFSILCIFTDLLFLVFAGLVWHAGSPMNGMFDAFGPVYSWFMTHIIFYYGPHFLVSLSALVSSVGILMKKAWAVSLFVTVLLILIFLHLVMIILSLAMLFTYPDKPSFNGFYFPQGLMVFSHVFGMVFQVAISILYAWLWTRFRKKEVQKVFS